MYLLQEIRSFLHEHGEQSKEQGCLPLCSPGPLYSASWPKSMFFLRATCQFCSGCVLNLSSYYIYMPPLHLPPMWQQSTHTAFPTKQLGKSFSPQSSLLLSNFILFCLCSKENKKAPTEKGRIVSRYFNLDFSNVFSGSMFILRFFNAGCKRLCQLKGLSANTSTIIYAPRGAIQTALNSAAKQVLNWWENPQEKLVCFLRSYINIGECLPFPLYPYFPLFLLQIKKDLTLPQALINFFIIYSIFYWLRCETEIFSVTFWGKNGGKLWLHLCKQKAKWARSQNKFCLEILRMDNFCSHAPKIMTQFLKPI